MNGRDVRHEVLIATGTIRPPEVAGHPLHAYWLLIAPHLRDVLLPPQRRFGDDHLSWSWLGPAEAPPPTAAELARLQQRLEAGLDSLAESEEESGERRALREQVARTLRTWAEGVSSGLNDRFAGYVARTDHGWQVHSWGLSTPGPVTTPGRVADPEATASPAAKTTNAREHRLRRWWPLRFILLLGVLVAVGVGVRRKLEGTDPAAPAPPAAAESDRVAPTPETSTTAARSAPEPARDAAPAQPGSATGSAGRSRSEAPAASRAAAAGSIWLAEGERFAARDALPAIGGPGTGGAMAAGAGAPTAAGAPATSAAQSGPAGLGTGAGTAAGGLAGATGTAATGSDGAAAPTDGTPAERGSPSDGIRGAVAPPPQDAPATDSRQAGEPEKPAPLDESDRPAPEQPHPPAREPGRSATVDPDAGAPSDSSPVGFAAPPSATASPPPSLVLLLRTGGWRTELLRDVILPTFPMPRSRTDSPGQVRTQAWEDQEALRPAFLDPERVRVGVTLRTPAAATAAWRIDPPDGGSWAVRRERDGLSLDLSCPIGLASTGSVVVVDAAGRTLATAQFEPASGLVVRCEASTELMSWIELDLPADAGDGAWSVRGGPDRVATADSNPRRVAVMPSEPSADSAWTLAWTDKTTGWALVGEVSFAGP